MSPKLRLAKKLRGSEIIGAIVPVAFATGAAHELNSLDELKNLTDTGIKKILEVSNILDEAPKHYRDVIAERYECIKWECVVQQENVNRSTVSNVAKGLSANKKLKSFQCISDSSRETLEKLRAKCSVLPQDSETVVKNGLNVVLPYRLLIPGFTKYVQDLHQTKKEELSKTSNNETTKKILLGAEDKIKFLGSLLEQIKTHIETMGNNFFEIYVDFIHATETALKKIQREGTQKMLKCLS